MNKAIYVGIAMAVLMLVLPVGFWLLISCVEIYHGVMAGKY